MRMKMYNGLDWEVTKYGQLFDRADLENINYGVVTTKIYKYQEKFYVEVWQNGIRLAFIELID